MSKKNSLEAKRLLRKAKRYDSGYPEFYTNKVNAKGYSKLVSVLKVPYEPEPIAKVMRGFVMNHWFKLLNLTKES